MKNFKSALLIPLSLGLFQGNVYAMDIKDHIRIEKAKIEFEFNCTVSGTIDENESIYPANTPEAAKVLAIAKSVKSDVQCVKPKYQYSCFLPENRNIPLSGSITYSYWSNSPTLSEFKKSETGKKLRGCQAPWW
ncbi:hypothetical protein ACYZTM_23020 [Pseudomonas sp. MDT2-39-1]|uniref:hypothetical protein n=1 Tax=Pseudomonas sp. BGI-2 TaxID=2528211 RepID=UPI0010343865|nr:hypothetical protein [Pseudomonas sp. BGI-2]TBN46929.1 hypothetical protein EYC95_11475 [Pseudomonas sp. BGI-2]